MPVCGAFLLSDWLTPLTSEPGSASPLAVLEASTRHHTGKWLGRGGSGCDLLRRSHEGRLRLLSVLQGDVALH